MSTFYLSIFPILKFLAEGDCWPLVCWPHEINNIAVKAE